MKIVCPWKRKSRDFGLSDNACDKEVVHEVKVQGSILAFDMVRSYLSMEHFSRSVETVFLLFLTRTERNGLNLLRIRFKRLPLSNVMGSTPSSFQKKKNNN